MDFVFLPSYSQYIPFLGKACPAGKDGLWFKIIPSEKRETGRSYFTMISYDLKNEIEDLTSKNPEVYKADPLSFYEIDRELNSFIHPFNSSRITVRQGVSRDGYLKKANELLQHIHRGDIYEINLCINFFAENVEIDPVEVFRRLSSISEAPFSFLSGTNGIYILCASPERFLKKQGSRLISQPIKGTRKRGASQDEDELLKESLKMDPKERSENIMIVDLVRNDLSRIADPGTVTVDELCGIYTFKQVHQMISTISCSTSVNDLDTILKATFPMGSMTGAPKIRAMQLIDEAENFRRSYYSGSVGFINDNSDFDLNVVIRSIIYDSRKKYLSFSVGSAITAASQPELEYYECLVKARALFTALGCGDQWEKIFAEG